jgi:RNA polymerase sigma-70 factor (ECF subfamily)
MNNLSAQPENKLIAAARAGNEEAFTELVKRHSSKVYGVSLKMLKNREDAEDNLQNALFKAYHNLDRFEGQSQFSTWLFRITINEALMKLRKQQFERKVTYSDSAHGDGENVEMFEIQDTRQDQEQEYISRELAAKAMHGLSPSLKSTFVLHKAEGWTNRELAAAQGVTVETVKSRVFRARARLRRQLEALSEAPPMAYQA